MSLTAVDLVAGAVTPPWNTRRPTQPLPVSGSTHWDRPTCSHVSGRVGKQVSTDAGRRVKTQIRFETQLRVGRSSRASSHCDQSVHSAASAVPDCGLWVVTYCTQHKHPPPTGDTFTRAYHAVMYPTRSLPPLNPALAPRKFTGFLNGRVR